MMGFLKTVLFVLLLSVIFQQGKKMLLPKLPQKGEGYAAPGWRKVADVFRRNIDTGSEPGGMCNFNVSISNMHQMANIIITIITDK